MKKMRLTTLAKQLGMDYNKLIGLKGQKLSPHHFSGMGKYTWLTPEGVELLKLAVLAPLAVPDKLTAIVLSPARNPRWVYAKLTGKDGRVPVAIPRKLIADRMVGKIIPVEAITDATGQTTYRHEILSRIT